MTSFITTMFVNPISPHTRFPQSPKPLPPVYTLPNFDGLTLDLPSECHSQRLPEGVCGSFIHTNTACGIHSLGAIAGVSGDIPVRIRGDAASCGIQKLEEGGHSFAVVREGHRIREADLAFNPLALELPQPAYISPLQKMFSSALQKQMGIAANVPIPEDDNSSSLCDNQGFTECNPPNTVANIARAFLERHLRQADGFLLQKLCGRSSSAADHPNAPPSSPIPEDPGPEIPLKSTLRAATTRISDPVFDEDSADKIDSDSNSRSRAPFKPSSKAGRGTSSWQLRQFAEATLGSGSLRKAVMLPEGEDKDEWMAVNVVDFYNQINLLYGSITEFCSPQSCPEMKATDEFEYLWQDSETFKRPTKMPAPEYIEHLMAWVQGNIDNEQMFPSRIGVPFPKSFAPLVKQIFKRLYRVYAHIYCHHYPVVVQLGLEPHLNTSFKHYVLFIDEHGLASGKDYWGPLGDLVENMLASD